MKLALVFLCAGSLSAAAGEESPLPRLDELPSPSTRLSVEEAYAAIPHRRTIFGFERSAISGVERSYLRLMFSSIDRAVALRVSAYQSFYHGAADREALLEGMSALANFVESRITPPKGLESYHAQVVSALEDQRAFFAEWSRRGDAFEYREGNRLARHPLIQRSSRALRGAYGVLMSRYGAREDTQNQNAFFDYHCALDFL
jgi:hypothetical protein